MNTPLDRASFCEYLASELDLPAEIVTPDARLTSQLGLDSVRRLEVLVIIEELGVELDENDMGSPNTVDDVYKVYLGAMALED
jgi:acyl carrier protein